MGLFFYRRHDTSIYILSKFWFEFLKCVLDLVTFSEKGFEEKKRVPIMRSKDDLLFGNRVEIRNNRIFIKPNAIRKCSINGQFFDEIEGMVLSFI